MTILLKITKILYDIREGQYHPPDSSIEIIKLMQADISLYWRRRSLKIISYKIWKSPQNQSTLTLVFSPFIFFKLSYNWGGLIDIWLYCHYFVISLCCNFQRNFIFKLHVSFTLTKCSNKLNNPLQSHCHKRLGTDLLREKRYILSDHVLFESNSVVLCFSNILKDLSSHKV